MKFLTAIFLVVSYQSFAAVPLEKKLDELNIPDDKISNVISEDKVFVVNKRYSSLVNRHEVTFAGGNNFTGDSHLSTQQLAATYRYHLNSKWSFGLRYQEIFNELTTTGAQLFTEEKIFPDTDFALSSYEAFATYNTIYGKLRWSADTVVYFDQYISLGYGQIELSFGDQNLFVADAGIAFWLGKHMSTRVGVRNEFYEQNQLRGTRSIHNAVGYIEIGYLFGQGS